MWPFNPKPYKPHTNPKAISHAFVSLGSWAITAEGSRHLGIGLRELQGTGLGLRDSGNSDVLQGTETQEFMQFIRDLEFLGYPKS